MARGAAGPHQQKRCYAAATGQLAHQWQKPPF
ncbi:hypothetical protein A2U01_0084129, partial [Trifolium medium]|nr:hypothetical protein [Trifolium medium]